MLIKTKEQAVTCTVRWNFTVEFVVNICIFIPLKYSCHLQDIKADLNLLAAYKPIQYIMIRKHLVLTGVIISLAFFIIAISIYPGGSMFDKNAIGFDLTKNFISNLFAAKALNGAENPSRIWACLGMILLPLSYAIFFINMSKKISENNVTIILKYASATNVLCMFLIVTPLHDLMLNISISLFWTCIFIITVYILKTKLHLFKFLCVLCLVIFYYSIYLWATNDWELLPAMQQLNFINSTLLILGLEYFTKQEDFAHIKSRTPKAKPTNR